MNSARKDQPPIPIVEAKLQAHIGRRLRELYDQMVSEPAPDRFKRLLDELEAREARPAAPEPEVSIGADIPPEASEPPQ